MTNGQKFTQIFVPWAISPIVPHSTHLVLPKFRLLLGRRHFADRQTDRQTCHPAHMHTPLYSKHMAFCTRSHCRTEHKMTQGMFCLTGQMSIVCFSSSKIITNPLRGNGYIYKHSVLFTRHIMHSNICQRIFPHISLGI